MTPAAASTDSIYPNFESDAGVGSFRNAYAPFQDKKTDIAILRGKYLLNVGKGVDVFGKIKFIDETDKRMNDARFLPYQAGRLPGRRCGVPQQRQQLLRAGHSTADHLRQPAGDHRQRRHRLPVEAVRQPVGRRPRPQLQALPARRRLPAHRTTCTAR